MVGGRDGEEAKSWRFQSESLKRQALSCIATARRLPLRCQLALIHLQYARIPRACYCMILYTDGDLLDGSSDVRFTKSQTHL